MISHANHEPTTRKHLPFGVINGGWKIRELFMVFWWENHRAKWGILQPCLMTPKASLISHHPIIIPFNIPLIPHDYPINHCGQNFVFLQSRNNSPSLAMTQVPAKKPRYLAHGPHGMSRWETWKPQRLNSGLIGQWWSMFWFFGHKWTG